MTLASKHRARALVLQQHSRYRDAVRAWDLAIAEDPHDFEALSHRALCHCELEELDAAEADARAALAVAPDVDFTHRTLARVLHARGDFEGAARHAERAATLDPEDANNHSVRAMVALARQRWQEALGAADAGLAIRPDHLDSLNLRAVALRQLGRNAEATATIDGALALAPSSAAVHANQGWSLLHAGDFRQAELHFLEALRLDSTFDWAREGLVTSLKARSPIYRLVLAYLFWMSRLRRRAGAAVMIGSYLAFRVIASSLSGTPYFWPAILTLASAFLLTWIANPLGDLMLFLHPVGRHALSRDERRGALLLGCLLLLLVAVAIPAARTLSFDLVLAAFACVPAIMIGSTLFRQPVGKARMVASGFLAIALAIVAIYLVCWWALPSVAEAAHGARTRTPLTPAQLLLAQVHATVFHAGWMVDLAMLFAVQFLPALFRRR